MASASDRECPEVNSEPAEVTTKVKLVRHDLNAYGLKDKSIEKGIYVEVAGEVDKETFIKDNLLPSDSILKVKVNGNYIPWSLIPLCCADQIEIQVVRPHQNVKPHAQKFVEGHETFRAAVSTLETRVASLEEEAKPEVLKMKEEKDVDALCKQVEFLQRRLDEAEKAEWVRDDDGPTTSSAAAAATVHNNPTPSSP